MAGGMEETAREPRRHGCAVPPTHAQAHLGQVKRTWRPYRTGQQELPLVTALRLPSTAGGHLLLARPAGVQVHCEGWSNERHRRCYSGAAARRTAPRAGQKQNKTCVLFGFLLNFPRPRRHRPIHPLALPLYPSRPLTARIRSAKVVILAGTGRDGAGMGMNVPDARELIHNTVLCSR